MSIDSPPTPLLAVLLTATAFVVVEVVVHLEAGRSMADLVGLGYLLASPVVYRGFERLLAAAPVVGGAEPSPAGGR